MLHCVHFQEDLSTSWEHQKQNYAQSQIFDRLSDIYQ